MAEAQNKPPAYADVPPSATNPYHVGYDQPGNQGFSPGNQDVVAMQHGTMPHQHTVPGLSMQSNTVIITSQPQPTILISQPRGRDLTIPAILSCIFCCFCTGVPAIMFATKAQNEYSKGDWQAAERSQRVACGLIVSSVILHLIIWGIVVVLFFAVTTNN